MWELNLNNLMEYLKFFVLKQVWDFLVVYYKKDLRELVSVIEMTI